MARSSGEGRIIPGSHCPKCNEALEYNGNYWCSDVDCPYIMPADRMRGSDKRAFNIAYVLLMQQLGREPRADVLYQDYL
jgi:predicted nucleic acid-binding Zn ribbon protein